ncbi:extracellular solute-binding protein [Microbacterium hydrocarbonoxydans]|uniref:extracellular solute-binding protein n=1 Tax=Microbacterium hydrocarbonoxydans TaxID=273678 RepID=UPI0013D995BA|nr:extracellular solute-binding protein [Microbacterium hydrocarbonoxydans]
MSINEIAADRRTFLKVAGIGLLSVASIGSLAGCGTRTELVASGASSVKLPAFVPADGLAPDLAGTAGGVPAAYFRYPANPVRTVTTPPLKGETFTAITNIFGPPPNGRDSNPAWQEIEKRLGGRVDITAVSADDFTTKMNTTIAGNDIPDLMLDDGASIPDTIGFLESKCQDLTKFLSGDAIKEYPNLAAIPELYWRQTVRNGKIYTIPIPRGGSAGLGFYNAKRFEDVGITDTSAIKDADEYLSVMKELTDAKANRWAFGASSFGLSTFHQLFGVPNQWREDGGRLTYSFETEEYLDSIQFVQKAASAGYILPGSESWTKSQMVNAFTTGQVAQIYDGLPAFFKSDGYGPTVPDSAPFLPFAAGGGKPTAWLDNILFARTMFKKNDAASIKKLLGVANLLAAPFGSEEYLLINYGVEGADYTLDGDGNPLPTPNALADTTVPWKYIAAPGPVLYLPGQDRIVTRAHEAYSALIPIGVEDPTATLFSPTNAQKGSTIRQAVGDATQDFIAGRKSLADVKAAIKTWRSAGGDKIRKEFEKALDA